MGVIDFLTKPVVAWLNREKSRKHSHLSDFERIKFELKPCDVILIEGRSRVSEVIRITTQSPWTHAALYIGRVHDVEDDDLKKIILHHYDGDPADRLIIESLLGHGTIVRNLNVYETEHIRLCRPARLGMKDSQQTIRYAVSRLGVDYDVRQILDLLRFLFPWTVLPRRWRSSLFRHNPGRSTRTVCSTMIAEAFAFVQFPILPLVKLSGEDQVQLFRRNPKLCTPSDFDYSPYFKIIKYPFVDIHYHDDHRLLPWHGSSQLDEDEAGVYMGAETQPTSEAVEEAISQAVAVSQGVESSNENGDTPDKIREQASTEEIATQALDRKDDFDATEEPPHQASETSIDKPQIH